jgi:hypothetical protein
MAAFACTSFTHPAPHPFSPMHHEPSETYREGTRAGARGIRDATAAPRGHAKTGLVRLEEKRRRGHQPNGPGDLRVENRLGRGRLFRRKVSWLSAFRIGSSPRHGNCPSRKVETHAGVLTTTSCGLGHGSTT